MIPDGAQRSRKLSAGLLRHLGRNRIIREGDDPAKSRDLLCLTAPPQSDLPLTILYNFLSIHRRLPRSKTVELEVRRDLTVGVS
jgi:hypothetical protein